MSLISAGLPRLVASRRLRATQAAAAVVATIGAAGLSFVAPAAGSPRPCGGHGSLQLAYSDGEGIILADLAGRRLRRISHPRTGWIDADPAWSPDAKRIAFARYFADNPSGVDLYIVDADGRDQHLRQTGASRPSWSPSGTEMLVQRTNGHDFWSAIIDANSKTREIDLQGEAAWAPDRRHLAVVTYDGLAVADAHGGHPRTIWHGRSASSPAWSPNGKRIAFVAPTDHRRGALGIWTVDADGANSKLLFRGYGADSPDWAPNGQRITFATVRGGRGAIDLINADGSGHRILERNDGVEPTWSPDGNWIAYPTSARSFMSNVYLVRPNGSGLHMLPPVWTFSPRLSWRPCFDR